jgi:hypothetical protein
MLNLTIKMIFNHGSYVVHAEVNAILNTNHASAAGQVSLSALLCHHTICSSFFLVVCTLFTSLKNLLVLCFFPLLQKLYVTMFPCNECAKIIIQVCPFVGSYNGALQFISVPIMEHYSSIHVNRYSYYAFPKYSPGFEVHFCTLQPKH